MPEGGGVRGGGGAKPPSKERSDAGRERSDREAVPLAKGAVFRPVGVMRIKLRKTQ